MEAAMAPCASLRSLRLGSSEALRMFRVPVSARRISRPAPGVFLRQRRRAAVSMSADVSSQRLPTGNFFQFCELVAKSVQGFYEQASASAARNISMAQGAVGLPHLKPKTEEELQLLTALKGRLLCAAAPLFFAAINQSAPVNTPLTVVASGMAKWLELYSGVLMVRVLLSWFPNIPWERQPLQAMRDMCDPYLNLFRNIVPPLFNALDLSPMLAFLVLGVLTSILNTTVQQG